MSEHPQEPKHVSLLTELIDSARAKTDMSKIVDFASASLAARLDARAKRIAPTAEAIGAAE